MAFAASIGAVVPARVQTVGSNTSAQLNPPPHPPPRTPGGRGLRQPRMLQGPLEPILFSDLVQPNTNSLPFS